MIFADLIRKCLPVKLLVMFALILSESALKAQNTVGIGTPSPNTNAVLDLVSPGGNQGVLVPRITTSQRQAMASALGTAETGLVVFDADLKQFFHWVDNTWVVGLGAFSEIAGGDLQGNYPNPTLRPDVVNSNTILDGSVTTADIGDASVTSAKINAEGNGNSILGTDVAGVPRWEPKSNFLGNDLQDGNIMIGDAANIAQPRVVSGDLSLANDGSATISDGSINSAKILDDAINASDIGTDAVGNDELASNSVTGDEIVDGSIQSVDIASGAVTSVNIADGTIATDDIESGGNNKVLITTAAGTVFWENITLFETSTLAEGNVFVGDVTNTAAPLNARGAGRILIGDGTSVQSLNVNGDLSLSATGDAQINSGVVGSPEVTDNSLTVDDIAPNAIESSELADNAVDNGAIQDHAVSTVKIQDNAINTQKIATGAVTSNQISDGTVQNADLADDIVNTDKIDGEGSGNSVLTTDTGGNPQWESRSNFGTSSLPSANIFVGDAGGISQPRPVSGDITLNNTGNMQINNDVIGTAEIVDNSITVDDIGPNSIESSELADNAVDVGALQSNAVTTPKIADDAVSPAKIDGGGNINAILTTDLLGNPQWEIKSGLDVDPFNEIQDLSLAGNTLSLTGDATNVDLSGYLDNTDSQDLDNVLTQGNDAGGTSITNLAEPANAQDAATKNYVDALEAADADGDPTNEIQDLSLTGNTLSLTDDATDVDLSGYLDNTDAQDMSLTGNTLSITGDATPVDLSGYLDNTDSQNLTNVLSQGNNAGGSAITNVANPTNPQDVATKNYVDNISIGTGNLADNAVTSTKILNGTMVNADINAAAAIDGSKITPDFGTQNIQTTGTLNTGSATVSSLTVTDLGGATDSYTGDGTVNSFTISPAGAFSSSDVRLKENIEEIPQALEKISQVSGKRYTFINDDKRQLHYGVIAQDLQKLFPHLVQENQHGYLSVNYLELIPVLIEALKAQQFIISQLQQDRAAMEKDIMEIKQSLGIEAKN